MSDLISRQAAIEAVQEQIMVRLDWHSDSHAERRGLDVALCVLADLPSAQPERKSGQWVQFSAGSHLYYCGLCGQWADRHWKFCPNCGARMEAEEAET